MCGPGSGFGTGFEMSALINKKKKEAEKNMGPNEASGKPSDTPQQGDSAVIGASDEEVRRRRAASNTNKTGAQGDTSTANVQVKTLLGQ